MIESMTGFGRCEILEGDRKAAVELKSVNHRYLDMNIKLPKKLNLFEGAIRSLLKEYIQRGKVDVFFTYEDYTKNNFTLNYNEAVAAEYFKHIKRMAEQFDIDNDVKASTLSRYPEVLTLEEQEVDESTVWPLVERAIRGAAIQFVESREKEGEHLKKDLIEKLDTMLSYVDFIEERSPEIMRDYREKLEAKVTELLGDTSMDEARIATEVTIFSDKICVDEEIVRLRSHINNMKEELNRGGCIGRKLDFIAQEMNREANTILSKANDLAISDTGINLKTDIEKVREQIQNIE